MEGTMHDEIQPKAPPSRAAAYEAIRGHLEFLYGRLRGRRAYARLRDLLAESAARIAPPRSVPDASAELPLDERDAFLITYGDQFRTTGQAPLATLQKFLEEHAAGSVTGVHVLPFFPYTSDDGFSVVDFRAVNPDWGDWEQVEAVADRFRLMVDLVLNHISAGSEWFQGFLRDEEPFTEWFIVVPPGTDLSEVVRPRALPLLTPVRTPSGKKLVWTTFSADQIDLNYRNPDVLLEMVRTLLLYVERGAQVIRLDAVAYLWKEIGTPCIHLPETHRVVQLFRSVFDAVAPWVLIITETNVPHRDNISYFGDGRNEAQLVYQFSLPPLVLDAFRRADTAALRRWASDLGEPVGNITFFNFLASHDGVGLNPARGILSEEQLRELASMVEARGGRVSYRSGPSGERPYELNISYFDGIAGSDGGDELPLELQVRKFLCSQAIMLAFRGVPGIYIHSLLGTRNFLEGVRETGINRTINRRKFRLEDIGGVLGRQESREAGVFRGYTELLRARRSAPAFHPLAGQKVLETPASVFALVRESRDGAQKLLCAFNTSGAEVLLRVPAGDLGVEAGRHGRLLAGGGESGWSVPGPDTGRDQAPAAGAKQPPDSSAVPEAPSPRWDGGTLELSLEPFGFRWVCW
jgi:glycosidase